MLLTDQERKQFATLINALIDIPLVSEDMEQVIFEHALGIIDAVLRDTLPVIFHEMMRDAERGIDKDQAQDFADRLVVSVNRQVDLPYLTEEQEAQLLRTVVNPLVKAMTQGKRLQDLLPALEATGLSGTTSS